MTQYAGVVVCERTNKSARLQVAMKPRGDKVEEMPRTGVTALVDGNSKHDFKAQKMEGEFHGKWEIAMMTESY